MRVVSPDIGFPEVTLAEEQLEYMAMTAALVPHDDGTVGVVSRWRLSDEDLEALASGSDLYLVLLTADGSAQPVHLTVGNPYADAGTP